MDLHRQVRLALRGAGAGQRLSFAGREAAADADLADHPRTDAGIAHADGDVADDLVGDLALAFRVVLGRLRTVQVVAGAHDDVEPGCAAHLGEPQRVAPQAVGGGLDDRLAALVGEATHLADRQVEIVHHAVVATDERIVAQLPDVRDRDRLVDELARARRAIERRMPPGEGVVEDVLVRQGQAHVGAVDRARHRLDLHHARSLAGRRSARRRVAQAPTARIRAEAAKTGARPSSSPGDGAPSGATAAVIAEPATLPA